MTYLQSRPAPAEARYNACTLEWCDLAYTLGRFGLTPADAGWELVIRPDATVDLEIGGACPLAVQDDAQRRYSRGDVMIWDEMNDVWLKMRDTTLLNDKYPVRIKVALVTLIDWED
jgi:hypothetical protein